MTSFLDYYKILLPGPLPLASSALASQSLSTVLPEWPFHAQHLRHSSAKTCQCLPIPYKGLAPDTCLPSQSPIMPSGIRYKGEHSSASFPSRKVPFIRQDPPNASLLWRFSRFPQQSQGSHINWHLWLTAGSTEQQPLVYILDSPSITCSLRVWHLCPPVCSPEIGSKQYSANSCCTATCRENLF